MTFAEALAIHKQNQADDVTIKPTTRHYWNQIFTALIISWPGLAEREIRRITATECKEWARAFRKTSSSTRYNNTLSGLRHVLDLAIEAGVVYGNAVAKLERVPVRQKQITIRSREQFGKMREDELFKVTLRRRAQIEARVAVLKNVFLGGTPRAKGFENRQLQVAWAVLSHNLRVLAQLPWACDQKAVAEAA